MKEFESILELPRDIRGKVKEWLGDGSKKEGKRELSRMLLENFGICVVLDEGNVIGVTPVESGLEKNDLWQSSNYIFVRGLLNKRPNQNHNHIGKEGHSGGYRGNHRSHVRGAGAIHYFIRGGVSMPPGFRGKRKS